MISFTIWGDPKAQKRHAKGRWGNYDPSAGDKDNFLAKAIENRPPTPFDFPVSVNIVAYFSRPKRHFTKKGLRPDAEIWYSSRPDADNVIKFILDALNGIFWKDDSFVSHVSLSKKYSKVPCIYMEIEKL